MKDVVPDKIRNVAVTGHGSSGKTTLVAGVLFDTGVTTRLTKVDKGNTVTDYDPEAPQPPKRPTRPARAC